MDQPAYLYDELARYILHLATKKSGNGGKLGGYVLSAPGRGMEIIIAQADELWSLGDSKKNPVWIWLLLDLETRQVAACHFGGRTRQDAIKLWTNVPAESG